MTKHSALIIVCALVALAGCKKDSPPELEAKSAPDVGAAPGSKAAQAEVDKAASVALAMCSKGLDEATWSDLKKNDKLVGVFSHPRDPGFDFTKDGSYPWVATKAAVVEFTDEEMTISIVADDTDPCALKPYADLMTSRKNPAAQLRIMGTKPGDYAGWTAAADGLKANFSFGATNNGKYMPNPFDGPTLTRLTKVTQGTSVEFDLHGCEAQISGLMGTKPRHFVIGHVLATWCPKS
jgi:hypothetical protein